MVKFPSGSFTAYRGNTGTEDKRATVSLTLQRSTAAFHAGQRGKTVDTFTVPVSSVLGYSEAIGRGTFAEEEVIVPTQGLKRL